MRALLLVVALLVSFVGMQTHHAGVAADEEPIHLTLRLGPNDGEPAGRLGPTDGEPAGRLGSSDAAVTIATNYRDAGRLILFINQVEVDAIYVDASSGAPFEDDGTELAGDHQVVFHISPERLESVVGPLSAPDRPPLEVSAALFTPQVRLVAFSGVRGYLYRSWLELPSGPLRAQAAMGERQPTAMEADPNAELDPKSIDAQGHFESTARFYLILASSDRKSLTLPPDNFTLFDRARVLEAAPVPTSARSAPLPIEIPPRTRNENYIVLWTLHDSYTPGANVSGSLWSRSQIYEHPGAERVK